MMGGMIWSTIELAQKVDQSMTMPTLRLFKKKKKTKLDNPKSDLDFYLHQYDSYETYKETQIFYNKKKIQNIWADKTTLTLVKDIVSKEVPNRSFAGICHGSRNGFEQNFLSEDNKFDVFGTDISPTAKQFERSIEWDFHDEKEEWKNKFDFIYSNSLDQGWNPRKALTTWLNQIHQNGVVIIEHTNAHGPQWAGEMDPFGVKPNVMPYVFAEWFGHQISTSFESVQKDNKDLKAWLFILKKNVLVVT
ncbi:hypothetical protein SAMN04488518_107165 [Pseudovibrio ascidiaceicola]|uniref:Methyltransferase domain-containing protein n=1 Tax=Pseudovibrio ascidiaceicola TaxID=285279 RepID=A0A1I4B6U0_9HYPH|nr:hypothetical protein [Pseudovibrio ascidiaceicola]SFK64243.1 hypothetical protein SAMN04488518_107165 [Pseudovibrio ascidiaceicola]